MKKEFVVSLLLVSVFLIGNAEMALAQCMGPDDYDEYCCDGIVREDGEVQYTTSDVCMALCDDDPFLLEISSDYYGGHLYPATDTGHYLGTVDSYFGWGGCSVEFKRRGQVLVKLTWIQDDDGWVTAFNCKPGNCCDW